MKQSYEDLMPIVMKILSDGRLYKNKEIQDKVADIVELTEEEKREVVSSGIQTFRSRTNWAITYLKKAGLVDKVSRGVFKISEAGKAVMNNPPETINNTFLLKYDSFKNWVLGSSDEIQEQKGDEEIIINETPEDRISSAIEFINKSLAEDLLAEVLNNSPDFFERLVVKLLVAMGYGGIENARVVGKSGDDGIDGIINSDKLGFEKICIQAKRYNPDNSVSNKEIRDFSGALLQMGVSKGVFITTSHFSPKAIKAAEAIKQQQIILIDGFKLTNLMIEYNIGVSEVKRYVVKRLDSDFFDED